jgi:hypothetical protein
MADKQRAMQVADGEAPDRGLDAATRAEVEAFRDLSARVRATSASEAPVPDFEAFFARVEARVDGEARSLREAEAEAGGLRGFWQALSGRRPLWMLAPAGALMMAAALAWVLMSGGEAPPDNTCFVDSYDVDEGSVVVDQDPDEPGQATVIWVLDEGEG